MASRSRGLSAPVTTAAAPGWASRASARLARASKSGCSWVTMSFTGSQCCTPDLLRPSRFASDSGGLLLLGQFADSADGEAGVHDAVLDEHVAGAASAASGADHEQAGNVAFERVGVEVCCQAAAVGVYADRVEQRGISVVSREKVCLMCRDGEAAAAVAHQDRVRCYLLHHCLHVRLDGSFPDAVLEVGADPVLEAVPEVGPAVHDRDACTGAVQIEGCVRRTGAGADDGDPASVVQIGRASCRERGWVWVGAGRVKARTSAAE